MKSVRTMVAAALAAAGLVLGGGLSSQAAIDMPLDVTVAATGIKGPGYSTPGVAPAAWTNLGGVLASAPTVAVSHGITHYMAVAANGFLYHRTADSGWTRMVPDTFKCAYVSSMVDAGTVYLGCTGLNKALYELTFDGSDTAPFVENWTKLGGVIDGPAAGIEGEWYVKGGAFEVTDGVDTWLNNVYYFDGAWNRYDIWCDTPPGAASTGNYWTLACGAYVEETPMIYIERWDYNASAWTVTDFVAGATNYAPAVVQSSMDDSVDVVVQGTNGKVYTKKVTGTASTAPWTNLGGSVKYGVGAGSEFGPVLSPAAMQSLASKNRAAKPSIARG